jgi:hypothetical protein
MKTQTRWFIIGLIGLIVLSSLVSALPSAPVVQYIANSSATSSIVNRTQDQQGTITTVILSANQQDYKWKAYIGNVSGKVALDDANGKSIYDWNLGTTGGGEVYVSRFSTINWASIACVDQTSVDAEQTGLGIIFTARDSINATFNETTHRAFSVGTVGVSGCRSTATYINDNPQVMSSSAYFQEILLRDTINGHMVYSTLMETAHTGYDNSPHDFQLLVAENESATAPTTYFFWVELG